MQCLGIHRQSYSLTGSTNTLYGQKYILRCVKLVESDERDVVYQCDQCDAQSRANKEIESTPTKLRFDGIGRHTFWTADTDHGSDEPKEIRFW